MCRQHRTGPLPAMTAEATQWKRRLQRCSYTQGNANVRLQHLHSPTRQMTRHWSRRMQACHQSKSKVVPGQKVRIRFHCPTLAGHPVRCQRAAMVHPRKRCIQAKRIGLGDRADEQRCINTPCAR